MEKSSFIIANRQQLETTFRYAAGFGFDKPYVVEVKPLTRTIEQNSCLWAMLADISAQVVWHGQKLSSEDWKNVFSAALAKQRVVPNIDNSGFVVLGQSTSKMSVAQMSEMIELMMCFGAENSVSFKNE